MHRNILRIALPSILSNIVVPLLGLIDLAIAGHLGRAAFIGAVSVGAMMFNLTYWNFQFLRMGTSGMTAQEFGRGDMSGAFRILLRALALAATISLAILFVQYPLKRLLILAIGPSDDVRLFAESYFNICVWGAPALLSTLAFSGWFIGMQNSIYPMAVSIGINIVNILTSLLCVYGFNMGFDGIATGTLAAQWFGLAMSAALAFNLKRKHGIRLSVIINKSLLQGLNKFFKINSDIFLRSLCLMAVTLFFTAAGARSGDLTLAANALILQLYMLYSYFMDGFAFAGEALAGRYYGEQDRRKLRQSIIGVFQWGLAVMLIFSATYGVFSTQIMSLITDNRQVLAEAGKYHWWALAIPIAGAASFIWDGIYIGLTATRQMLAALAAATAVFFAIYYGLMFDDWLPDNHRLWLAFIAYLASRGIVQTLLASRIITRRF